LRDAIQRIAPAMPDYGYRMITNEPHRQRWGVGTRHVRRIMREDNLLCLRRRKSWTGYALRPRGLKLSQAPLGELSAVTTLARSAWATIADARPPNTRLCSGITAYQYA